MFALSKASVTLSTRQRVEKLSRGAAFQNETIRFAADSEVYRTTINVRPVDFRCEDVKAMTLIRRIEMNYGIDDFQVSSARRQRKVVRVNGAGNKGWLSSFRRGQ